MDPTRHYTSRFTMPVTDSTPHQNAAHGITADFLEHVRKKWLLLSGLATATVGLAIWAITQGAYDLTLWQVLNALFAGTGSAQDVVIWNIRMPRVIAALACGAGLSLSGLAIQSLLKNPLGSPSTLGISQGAAFGAALAIVVFGARVLSVTAFAFAGAMSATIVILILSGLKRLSPESVILAGVALSSLFASATIIIQYMSSETELAIVVFWTFGDVARSSWQEIGILTVLTCIVLLWLLMRQWDMNALISGDETAKGLGVSVTRMRIQGMIAASVVAALATAFHGVIAFVGLIAPHIARRMVGTDHRLLILFSAVLGALLLLLADTVGRVMIGAGALPVGVITSFMGAPMFLWLLLQEDRR